MHPLKFSFLTLIFIISACRSVETIKVSDNKENESLSLMTKNKSKKTDTTELVPRGLDLEKKLETIAFASCLDQDAPAPILKNIINSRADLYLALGDNVYASHENQKPISAQYKKLLNNSDYVQLRESIPTMAIWDDHDYGLNDGGAEWSGKYEAKEDFLKHFPYVKSSINTKQDGLFHSKIFGTKKNLVQIILLDTRWNRSNLIKNPDLTQPLKKYLPNLDKKTTLLGSQQWQWLERELEKKADIRFIISSIQLIADGHSFEKWGLFPHERERFFNLLKKSQAQNVFILSGDRHLASIAKTQIPNYGTLYDITSSSINKSKNFTETDPSYVGESTTLENFGIAQIDWDNKKITFKIVGQDDKILNQLEVPLK